MNSFDIRAVAMKSLILVLAFFLSAYLLIAVISTDRNQLSSLIEVSGYLLLPIAVFFPRMGFIILLLISGYLDFCKRLMVFFGDVGWLDVIDVLKLSPICLSGIFIGLIFRRWMQGSFFNKVEWYFFLFIVGYTFITFGSYYLQIKDLFSTIAVATNGSVYCFLILIVSMLKKEIKIKNIAVLLVCIYFPCAVYGVFQFLFGIADFEYKFFSLGVTTQRLYIYDTFHRSLGTLSTPGAYSTTMVVFFVLTLGLVLDEMKKTFSLVPRLFYVSSCGLFFIATITSLNRTAWAGAIIGIFAVIFFQSKYRTITFYSIISFIFLMIVLNASWLLLHMDDAQKLLPTGNNTTEAAFRLGTYGDRLVGFKNLTTNPKFWTLFGDKEILQSQMEGGKGENFSHDAVSTMLARYGIVGLILGTILLFLSLYKTHEKLLSLKKDRDFNLLIACVSAPVVIIILGIFSGYYLSTFPINLLFWLLISLLLRRIYVERSCDV